jgi:hypothetical protein
VIKCGLNFTAKLLSRAGRTLHEVQCHLDREGASDLVVELVIKSVHSPSIFVEAVELGSALLEGGNPIIQKSMYSKLMGGDLSQAFFKVNLQFLYIKFAVKVLFKCKDKNIMMNCSKTWLIQKSGDQKKRFFEL